MGSPTIGCSASLPVNPDKSWMSTLCGWTGYGKKWDKKTASEAVALVCAGIVVYKVWEVCQQETVPGTVQQELTQKVLDKAKKVAQDRWVLFCSGTAIGGMAMSGLEKLSLHELQVCFAQASFSMQMQHTQIVNALHTASKEKDREIEALKEQNTTLESKVSGLDAQQQIMAKQISALMKRMGTNQEQTAAPAIPVSVVESSAIPVSAQIVTEEKDLAECFEELLSSVNGNSTAKL